VRIIYDEQEVDFMVKTVAQLVEGGYISSYEENDLPQEFKTSTVLIFNHSRLLQMFCRSLREKKRSIFDNLRGHLGLPKLAKGFADYLGVILIPDQRGEKILFINADDYKNILEPILRKLESTEASKR
jgi:hypothetical protein